jgi:hypothetical protein
MYFWSFLVRLFLKYEKFQTNVAEKIETYFVFSDDFSKILSFMR